MLNDADPRKWTCPAHTRVKHELLEKYLRAWIPILGKWNPRIAYYDGFAGRGVYTDGTEGSPILAIRVADELAEHCGGVVFNFVEKNEDNFRNLNLELDRAKTQLQHVGRMTFIVKNDEFANVAGALLDFADENSTTLVPSFFFIDPFGFSGVPFEIIRRILASPKTEVFFTFMLREVNRFLASPQLADQMTMLFGCDRWKDLVALNDRQRALVELYRNMLHELAGTKYSLHFKVCESDSTATLYHLIHANNNFKGHRIMKNIMFNQGMEGTFAFLGSRDLAERTQTRLFDLHDTSVLRDELSRRFAGQTIAFDGIIEAMCHPWNEEPPFIDKHYREVIKSLEKNGSVRIQRVSSVRSGLKENDLVTFKSL